MQDFHVIYIKQNQFKYDLSLNLAQNADIFTACHTFISNKCHFLDHVVMATQINMTDVTSGAGTTHISGAPEFPPPRFLMWFVLLHLQFNMYVCISLFVLLSFLFWPLCCRRYTDSDCHFGIFKLFFSVFFFSCGI